MANPELHRDVRLAARAMGRHGFVHAYGHVSARIDEAHFLVSPACPLGLVGVNEQCVEVKLDAPLPSGALPEVRIHREIYRRRSDVGGICRVQPPQIMALSALGRAPRALHGLGTYFAPQPPLWDDPALVRNDEDAARLADMLGEANGIVMRGNGAVLAGASLPQAAAHVFFLEDAARIEIALLPISGDARPYTEDQVRTRAVGSGGLYERMWQFLCHGDPEWPATAS